MRIQAAAGILLAALLLPSVLGADGNRRDSPLETANDGTTVTALAVAATSGYVLLGTTDTGSELPGADVADLDAWFLYDERGNGINSGPADHPECAVRVQDMCQAPVTSVAISATGKRFAVASRITEDPLYDTAQDPPAPGETTDTVEGALHLGTDTQGVVRTELLGEPIRWVRMSADGAVVALVVEAGASDFRAGFFTWDGTAGAAGFTQVGPWQAVAAAVRDASLDASGARLVLAADRHYLVDRSPPALTKGSSSVSTVTAVATFDGLAASAAGTEGGNVALFDHGISKSVPQKSLKPGGSTAITSVAASPDKTHFAAGNDAGMLYLFARSTVPGEVFRLVASEDLGDGAVRDVHFAQGGQVVVARSGDDVSMHHLRADDLFPLWSEAVEDAGPVQSRADGEQTVAASAAVAVVLEAKHSVVGVPPDTIAIVPKASKLVDVTFRNDGNRPESVELGLDYPDGWFMSATPQNFSIDPDAEETVSVKVVSAAGAAPGLRQLYLNHTLAGRPFSTALRFDVPSSQSFHLLEGGPRSLAVRPGETVAFEVIVLNAGNVAATATVATSASAGWRAAAQKQYVPLEGGAEEAITVQLTAPRDAGEGDSGQATVSIVEAPGQELVLTGTVGARFAVELSGPPGLEVPSGGQGNVELKLKNLGNAPDGFVLSFDPAKVPAGSVGFATGLEKFTVRDVAPGATESVTVLVKMPGGTKEGVVLPITFTAASEGDATQKDTHLLQVAAGAPVEPTVPTQEEGGSGRLILVVLGVLLLLALAGGVVLLVMRKGDDGEP